MIIVLDAGHGENTPGKRSPDGKLREYKYCREIMKSVKEGLENLGYTVFTTIDTDYDVPLNTRVQTINKYCTKYGASNVLSVSIHCDAKGAAGKWENARGWSVRVALKHSTNSEKLAESLYNSAKSKGLKTRPYSAKSVYWSQNLAICRDTKCPAVLTENLFMDNKEDCEYLLSEEGRKTITALHIDGIVNYVKNK